jgi:hypothetical protein
MDLLASLGAAAEPIAVLGSNKGTSGVHEAGEGKRAGGEEGSLRSSGGADISTSSNQRGEKGSRLSGEDEGKMLLAEAEAVATLAAGVAGPSRRRVERPQNEPVDNTDVSADVTAVAALSHNGRHSARKRARQLDFGRSSPGSSAVFAQTYPIKGRQDTVDDDDDDDEEGSRSLSPSSAAGTLLGFAGAAAAQAWIGEAGGPSTPNKRKACNCKNSKCLKLYCECFASGSYCTLSCNCQGCQNNEHFQSQRKSAIDATLERNPMAFRPKIAASAMPAVEDSPSAHGRHTKGCHCKKSGCLKKYCECFQAGVLCSAQCKCHDCKNTEDSVERKSLLTSSGWDAPSPFERKDRLGTPSPIHTKRPHQQQSPNGLRFISHKSCLGQESGNPSLLEPATDRLPPMLMLPKMVGPGAGMGSAIAMQIQETMMNMRLAHKSSSPGFHISSSVVGLPQEREAKLAERMTIRNHLSDPMLFNLCRVLLLSAQKAADVGPGDEQQKQDAKSPPDPPGFAPASERHIHKKHKHGITANTEKDGSDKTAEAEQSTSAHADDEESAKDAPPAQRMQRAVLLELRHYLGQMQAIIQARPSQPSATSSCNGSSSKRKGDQPLCSRPPPPPPERDAPPSPPCSSECNGSTAEKEDGDGRGGRGR